RLDRLLRRADAGRGPGSEHPGPGRFRPGLRLRRPAGSPPRPAGPDPGVGASLSGTGGRRRRHSPDAGRWSRSAPGSDDRSGDQGDDGGGVRRGDLRLGLRRRGPGAAVLVGAQR
ncbi:hypothetical protein LTR94_035596, partial [Friedmanniomyces endolithicus]